MSKLLRETMKIFGSSAGANQIEQFGSLANGSPLYTTDIAVIQALANYLEGWFGGVVGSNLPAIEDINALFYLYAYQLAYLMQAGIAEWDAGTSYYIGSLVNTNGQIYYSLQDNNLNNALSNTAFWALKGQPQRQIFYHDGTFTVPQGVTRIKLIALSKGWGGAMAEAGNASTLIFVDNQGDLWGTGQNSQGETGTGTCSAGVGISSPTMVVGGVKFAKFPDLIPGQFYNRHALDVKGQLWGWGLNAFGELGVGDVVPRSSPVLVAGLSGSRFKKIIKYYTNGGALICLDALGQLWSWGSNANCNIGSGDDSGTVAAYSSPVLVIGGHVWKDMFMNQPTSNNPNFMAQILAIDTAGALWAWGSNVSGVCGTNTPPVAQPHLSSPTLVVGGISWATVFPEVNWDSGYNVHALDVNGNLWGWGNNLNGVLGNGVSPGVTIGYSSPVMVVGGVNYKTMASNLCTQGCSNTFFSTKMALDINGNAWAWGLNQAGVGNGVAPDIVGAYSSPVMVSGGHVFTQLYQDAEAFYGNGANFWGIDNLGQLWAWGANQAGLLGDGTIIDRSTPVMVVFPGSFGKITSMSLTRESFMATTYVVTDDKGNVYTWGSNYNGAIGNGDPNNQGNRAPVYSSPVLIAGGNKYAKVWNVFFENSFFAVDLIGNIYGWGANYKGELGLGDILTRSSPTLMLGTENINLLQNRHQIELDVTPGSTHNIVVGGFYAMFDLIEVGAMMDQLIVEYQL